MKSHTHGVLKPRFAVAMAMILVPLFNLSSSAQVVFRKGVTLAGDVSHFMDNNYAELQRILNTNAGVIGVNIPWFAATQDCNTCSAVKPLNPRNWNDPQYANSPLIQQIDAITSYVAAHGNGAFVLGITYGTPGWAACPEDPTDPNQQPYYPAEDAADYGDFMYAMSERYSGAHTSNSGVQIGKIRDWVVYNEVNSPTWWRSTACNTSHNSPIYYYEGSLNQAYTAVHHLPASLNVRVLAGAFTSYDRQDYQGTAGLRISTSYSDWQTNTANNDANHAWISPTDFVQALHDTGAQFDAIALHPYPPKIYSNPLAQPPAGAIALGNIATLLSQLATLYPSDPGKHHLALTEYFQQSYYGTESGWDQNSAIACPNYFCAQTTEVNLNSYLATAYSSSGSKQTNVDYLIWGQWQNVNPYVGGIVRANGSDKNTGFSGSIRATFTGITP